jgi:hypothetical protein
MGVLAFVLGVLIDFMGVLAFEPLIQWAEKVAARRGKNKAIVALAHKLARIAWVVLARQEDYRPRMSQAV